MNTKFRDQKFQHGAGPLTVASTRLVFNWMAIFRFTGYLMYNSFSLEKLVSLMFPRLH